ncbi:MAG: SDR family NAD(P)-dependent oxidoreductase [Bacteroidia bacterium]|nr:SDR family NAD(P)-dependent oxidoreductase [Bacteroidia bacterium]MCF8445648.1 SDR family NAD(P)-dependent oxidoreductase [Bacteroidia bacterium]
MNKKIAFITGASSGIGEATAILLAQNGYNLILNGRRAERIKVLQDRLVADYQIEAHAAIFDVRKKEEVKASIESIPEAFKNIDVLVNNAGLASGLSTLDKGSLEDWEDMIDTNIKGLLYVSRQVIPGMIDRKSGHIVNISSIAGKEVYANGNVYCATKFAVDALNKGMRIELASYPIRVTGIYPGAVETEFSIVRFHGDEEKAKAVYQGFDNLLASDIADAIHYAISRPAHVNINEMIVMPTAQPVPGIIHRK